MAGPSLSGQEIKEDHQESQQKQDFRHGSGLLGHTFRFLSSKLHAKKGSGMGSSARSFPTSSLWREQATLSPFQRSLRSLPPLLGLRPATKRAIPLGTPAALLPQISKLVPVEKPCPLSRPRTSSPTPFALRTKDKTCPCHCGALSEGLPLTLGKKKIKSRTVIAAARRGGRQESGHPPLGFRYHV